MIDMPSPCVHSWDGSAHRHWCVGMEACHKAPCRCQCGGEDWCTDHVSTDRTDPHRTERPKRKLPLIGV